MHSDKIIVVFIIISLHWQILTSVSARHWSQDICPPISQIALKNFLIISLIIKECPEDIFIKTSKYWRFQSLAETLNHQIEFVWFVPRYTTKKKKFNLHTFETVRSNSFTPNFGGKHSWIDCLFLYQRFQNAQK